MTGEYVEHSIQIDGDMFDSVMQHIAENFPTKTLAEVSVNLSTYGQVIAEQIGLEQVAVELEEDDGESEVSAGD